MIIFNSKKILIYYQNKFKTVILYSLLVRSIYQISICWKWHILFFSQSYKAISTFHIYNCVKSRLLHKISDYIFMNFVMLTILFFDKTVPAHILYRNKTESAAQQTTSKPIL